MASQMTIGKKLFGSFGACLVLTLVVGGTSLWLISSLGNSLNKLAHVTARKPLRPAPSTAFFPSPPSRKLFLPPPCSAHASTSSLCKD
jgi:hypothetical protein